MTKQAGRKKPKRKPIENAESIDLEFLSQVLDENRLEHDSEGWFTIPWRDGWNAVTLAHRLCPTWDALGAKNFMTIAISKRDASNQTYWQCDEYLSQISTNIGVDATFIYAALRCLQVLSSNSSGGGEVYNTILRRAVDKSGCNVEDIENSILIYRCLDAIGVGPLLMNDPHDRYRRAFTIAWKRGLFHAAYAINKRK